MIVRERVTDWINQNRRKSIWILLALLWALLCLAVLVLWFVVVPLLPSALTHTEWRLRSAQVVGGPTLWTSSDANRFTVEFGQGTISGRGSCNSYEGRYRLNQFTRSFSTSWVFHTLVGCVGEEAQEREVEFFHALDTASGYELRESELHIYYEDGTKELVFEPK